MVAKFTAVAAREENPKWSDFIKREDSLYSRINDSRSEFTRDYNRILHCTAYRRLKHKTQVFFAPDNDHICTRSEHVNHVTAISYTISKALDLNTELTNAIAIGHDLGHAPFGHAGGEILNQLTKDNIGEMFWHERNSLRFVDNLETITNTQNRQDNLNLTYAVRDGIVCHCGEIEQPSIHPRQDAINLHEISKPNQFQPYTWEGCVVKVADKIAYLGRDLEDAIRLEILSRHKFARESRHLIPYLLDNVSEVKYREINNTLLIHTFVLDLCESSSPESGIQFSERRLKLMKQLRQVSKDLIYKHPRLIQYENFVKLILESIFEVLSSCYTDRDMFIEHTQRRLRPYPLLRDSFLGWIIQYTDINQLKREEIGYENKIVYHMGNKDDYSRAIIDYISGMTDNYALRVFSELTSFI